MTQDIKKDTILQNIVKRLIRNGRTPVRLGAHEITSRASRDNVSCPMRLRFVVMMLLMMVMGASTAWGQAGVWYIANDKALEDNTTFSYGTSEPEDRYYLVPAKDPALADGKDAYFSENYEITDGDPETPYLTTFKTNRDANSVWVIKSTNDGKYFLIHVLTGKYAVYNTTPDCTSKPHRKVIHLETLADPDNVAKAKFYIENSSTTFRPQSLGSGNRFFNPSNGNKDFYNAQGGDCNNAGLVGVFSDASNRGSIWHLEPAQLTAPTISNPDANNKVTIADANGLPDGYQIRYTIDGSTTPTASTGEVYSGAIPITSSVTIKAVVVRYGMVLTEVASETREPVPCATPVISFDYTTSMVSITSATEGATFYYTTDGSTPTTGSIEYSGAFSVTSSTTIKAIATRTNWINSEVGTLTISQVATPTIQNNGSNAISITSDTPGATIYYTIDGTNPTTESSEYTTPLRENVSGVTIKAIAVKENMITSAVRSGSVTLQCEEPVIVRSSSTSFTVTCSFPASGVTIYYTTDGSSPTTSSSSTTSGGTISCELPATITAIAMATNYNNSTEVSVYLTQGMDGDGSAANPYIIEYQSDVTDFNTKANTVDGASKHYKIIATGTLNFSGVNIIRDFSGTFDGGYCILTGITHALFNNINGGTVKNVKLSNVNIPSGTYVGTICDEADGATKIYNCGVLSGSVTGSCAGGLVGHIKSSSNVRVVNCYNYGDVSGTDYAAGIVGYNEGTVGDVRIALCMMYGTVSDATTISPVYAGNHTSNVQNFTEYNFYLYSTEKDATTGQRIIRIPYTAYNDQLAIDKEEYLTRFPFYRHILNSHRELAAYFLFGPTVNGASDLTNAQISEIGHWVFDKSKADYPIIEKWNSNTKKIMDAPAGTSANVRDGEGNPITSLSVTVKIGTNTYNTYNGEPLSLPITAMDEANHDYTWGKVVLPFANEFEVNTDYTKVCTGWKITGITGGTEGSFSNYNVSDRNCTAKDLFSNTGFIFAQGGYFIVPYNVTGIEITANFATAYYLSDATYDVGYDTDYANPTGLGGSTNTTFQGQTVYNNIVEALKVMSAASTPHSQAIVLVGNYHFPTVIPANKDSNPLSSYTGKAFTLMSIDADNNQEPDYAWYSNNSLDRPAIAPVRFDFVAQIPLGMAANVTGSKGFPGIPIWRPRGWFEMTETSHSLINQFELNDGDFTASSSINNRCIINGGYFTQMVRARNKDANRLSYFQIGGNAYVKEFYPGNHSAVNYAVNLAPVNVTGGEIAECFMTGYGKGTAIGSDIYFWCAGGKIDKFLGAYMEKPKQTKTSDGNVNLTAMIDHAKIGRFFGGGTSPNAPITGDINVTINNSIVDFYCGGPEFGNMSSGKTVTTNATNTTFGKYYGAGFGGTSITYFNDKDDSNVDFSGDTKTYPGYFSTYYLSTSTGRLKKRTGYGIGSCYKFEYIYHSYNQCGVARFYTGYAKFDLATTGSVTNNLNGCTINDDFYGAGCQGMVSGTVYSTLTGCTISGSAYGGGFKATANEVDVYPATIPSLSVFTKETGLFSEFGTVSPDTYTWIQGDASHDEVAGTGADAGKLYTSKDIDMSALGNVTGAISLTVDGGSVTGNVFGGGNESKSLDNTTVTLKGDLTVGGNVFGGGNEAAVEGSAMVIIEE